MMVWLDQYSSMAPQRLAIYQKVSVTNLTRYNYAATDLFVDQRQVIATAAFLLIYLKDADKLV